MDESILVNGVPVEEYLTGVKQEKLIEESEQDWHQSLHSKSQDLSTQKRSRQTYTRRGLAQQRADDKRIGEQGKPFSKHSKVTRYDQWDLALEGEQNMAYQTIIDVFRDSSRHKLYDHEMVLNKLKDIQDRPPNLVQLKSIMRQLWRDGILTAYCVTDGQFVPYPEHSGTQRPYFILACNDDERENFLAMEDKDVIRNLEAFQQYCEKLFGPYQSEYVAMVKAEPIKNAGKAGGIYNHTMARKLCQATTPLTFNELLVSFQGNGYPMKDNGTIRAILKRFESFDLVNRFVKKGDEYLIVKERPQGEKCYFALKPFEELPLAEFMPEPEPEPEPEVEETEEIIGLPQTIDSYDRIIDALFPVQKDSSIKICKEVGLKGTVGTKIIGRAVFNIIRQAKRPMGTTLVLEEMSKLGFQKTSSPAIRTSFTKLHEAGLINYFKGKGGKFTKVDKAEHNANLHARLIKPAKVQDAEETISPALCGSLSDVVLDEEPLPVESIQPIVAAEPVAESPLQVTSDVSTMDSFVAMLKSQGVKRFEIEF